MALRLSTGLRNKAMGIRTNLVSNGSFDTNTTGWTASGATLSSVAGGSNSTNGLSIANSGAASGSAYQDVTTRIGRVYMVTFGGDTGDADGFQVKVGTTADDDAILTSPVYTDATLTTKKLAFVATATTTRISLVNTSVQSGEFVLFDDVLVEEVLDGFGEIMRGSKINIYTGTQPTLANDAATGTLLCTIGKNGSDGLEFTSADSGTIGKPVGDTWNGTSVASGTAGWFRCYEEGDDPTQISATAARFDGSVAVSGGQLNMTSTTVASGAVQTVSSMNLTQPAA
ncbi:DUF642 domain-containing protein [Pseudomethylobacillus aquaticus]|uniref:DUF642 domain-containing protein n=1 Tax=Pseudomethylobacillus aquaticus TaxID=2676064 RepID=A0A3N0V5C5_9PROT|nr:DUF642 domain-containing protein [Pseudomethylobacillus aquaticus]ROH88007.1 DUF642 domain-containing protein [Pseudomethylobacillus aquaticus]